MEPTIKGLREERGSLFARCEQIIERADAGSGKPAKNAEELKEFDRTMAQIGRLDAQIGQLEKRENANKQRVSDLHDRGVHYDAFGNSNSGGSESRDGLTGRERSLAFNMWARCGSSLSPTPAGLELANKAGFAPHERAIYFDLPEARAMGSLDATYGAKAVPQGFERSLERAMLAYGSVRSVARVVQTGGGGELRFPTTNDTGNKGRRLSENAQAQQTDVAISEVKLDAYTYSSDIVLVSVQLLQDEDVDLEAHIGEMLGERLGRIVNEEFTTGTGSSQPNGVVTSSFLGKATASPTVITYGELVDLQHSVDAAYQSNATWMLNFSTLAALKKIVDGDNRPLWQESSSAGFGGAFPGTILGRPYVINQQMASVGASAKPILYGDFSKYLVREVRGVQLMRLNERFADYHQVAFLAYLRTDADLLDAGTRPLKHLVMAAS